MKRYSLDICIPTKNDVIKLKYRTYSALEYHFLHTEDYLFLHLGKWFWKLMYKVRHRCGTTSSGHYPIIANTHKWLWISTIRGNHNRFLCTVCKQSFFSKKQNVNDLPKYSDKGRLKDVEQLNHMYNTATNDAERTAIKHSLFKIRQEDGKSRSMRDSLIKATRDANHDEIKNIHEYVAGKKSYVTDK